MRRIIRKPARSVALASLLECVVFTWGTAAAQEPPPVSPAGSTESYDAGGLEEILVTARKRAERVQDTPISLTVATGETLQNRSVTGFLDLQQQTPSFHMVPGSISATAVNASMRGQSLNDTRLNFDPAIGVYVDGVYLPRTVGLTLVSVDDIDRVEVLAGPQGTLYGKNTTGGAVVVYTKEPSTDAFEGLVKARYGNYGDRAITGLLNIPVSSNVAVRVLGNFAGLDGYGRNFTRDVKTGQSDTQYYRGAIAFTPTEKLKITLRGDYARVNMKREAQEAAFIVPLTTAANGAIVAPGATREAALEINNLTLDAFNALSQATRNTLLQQADANLRSFAAGDKDDAFNDIAGYDNSKVWGYSGTIEYDLNDDISFKSITAYRAFKRESNVDQDGTPYGILQTAFSAARDHQFSQEAQLAGSFFDNKLKSLVGIYYSKESGDEEIWTETLRITSGLNPITFQIADVGNSSFGLLTQHTLNITDQISVTAGIRYSKDKRTLNAHTRNTTHCTALGVTLASLPNGAADCNRPMEVSFDKISYTLGTEYRPTDDIMVYAKTNRGYRSGGLQQNAGATTAVIANAANQPFAPETVDDYEIGFKSEFWDRRVRLNVALYHLKGKGVQRVTAFPVPGTTAVATRILNAASTKVDGIEWDITARPVPELEFNFNGSYIDARFTNYVTPTGEDRTGIPLIYTPKWQYGLSGAYTFEIDNASWRNQIDYSWSSKQLTGEVGAYSPEHGILNARSALSFEDRGLQVALYMKNITDKRYLYSPTDVRSSVGIMFLNKYNPPRSYGMEITKKF